MPPKLIILLATFFLAACASAPPDGGFSQVSDLTRDRAGVEPQLRPPTPAAGDGEIDSTIQQIIAHPLSSDDAVKVALLQNPSLQASFGDLGIARADLVQAGLLKNPVFNAQVRFPSVSPSGTDVELSVAQDFLEILYLPMRTRIAAADLEQTRHSLTNTTLNLVADVRRAYVELQAAQENLAGKKLELDAAEAAAEMSVRLHQAGNASALQQFRDQASIEETRLDLVSAQASVAQARERFISLLGFADDDARIVLVAPLSSLPSDTQSAWIAAHRRHLFAGALIQREDLAASRSQVEALGRKARISDFQRYFPELTLGFDAEHEVAGDWLMGPNLSVPIPLFDQGQAQHEKAVAQFNQALHRHNALMNQIRSEVRTALLQIQTAESKARQYQTVILPLKHKIVEETQLQYNGMFVSVFDLLQSRAEELQAQRQAKDALADYWIARIELTRALGGKLPADLSLSDTPSSTQPTTQTSLETSHVHTP